MALTEYIPIRVTSLRGNQKAPFDVYVKVGQKFVLYSRRGDTFDGERLKRLADKKVSRLYIHMRDEEAYRTYLALNLEKAYSKVEGEPMSNRALVAQGIQQASLEELFDALDDSSQFQILQTDTRRYIDFILNENNALKEVLNIGNANGSVAHHCVNVASIALGIAQQMGISSEQELEQLALGCLLHDVDHVYNNLNTARPLSGFTEGELEVYHNHPQAGLERLKTTSFYSAEIKAIVADHHETINGEGFPSHCKTEKHLHPLVLIASVADQYDRLISYENVPEGEAVKKLMIDRVGLHPLKHIQALADHLKSQR